LDQDCLSRSYDRISRKVRIVAGLLRIISRHRTLALISIQSGGSYATRPQRADRAAQSASHTTAVQFSRHSQLLPERRGTFLSTRRGRALPRRDNAGSLIQLSRLAVRQFRPASRSSTRHHGGNLFPGGGIHALRRLVRTRWPPPLPAVSPAEAFCRSICSEYGEWRCVHRALAKSSIRALMWEGRHFLSWYTARSPAHARGIEHRSALARGDSERAVYHQLECANFFGYWRGRLDMKLRSR
jgi:hypothetical protein